MDDEASNYYAAVYMHKFRKIKAPENRLSDNVFRALLFTACPPRLSSNDDRPCDRAMSSVTQIGSMWR